MNLLFNSYVAKKQIYQATEEMYSKEDLENILHEVDEDLSRLASDLRMTPNRLRGEFLDARIKRMQKKLRLGK